MRQNPKKHIIPHFCSLGMKGAIYYRLIFKIMTVLRIKLNLRHKVQLAEDDLRKYFSYWLSLASDVMR